MRQLIIIALAGASMLPIPQDEPASSATTQVAQGVSPGKVAWHADYEAAVARAAESGKPVLLFQLLGRLNEEFC